MKRCGTCGAVLDDHVAFCNTCGSSVAANYPAYRRQPAKEPVSVGGWISESLDKVPVLGDQFECGDLHITVSRTDGHRVALAQVERQAAEA